MSKSWQLLIIIALILVGFYIGFDIYNSLTGQNVKFNKEITPIDADLREEVLQKVDESSDKLEYKDITGIND